MNADRFRKIFIICMIISLIIGEIFEQLYFRKIITVTRETVEMYYRILFIFTLILPCTMTTDEGGDIVVNFMRKYTMRSYRFLRKRQIKHKNIIQKIKINAILFFFLIVQPIVSLWVIYQVYFYAKIKTIRVNEKQEYTWLLKIQNKLMNFSAFFYIKYFQKIIVVFKTIIIFILLFMLILRQKNTTFLNILFFLNKIKNFFYFTYFYKNFSLNFFNIINIYNIPKILNQIISNIYFLKYSKKYIFDMLFTLNNIQKKIKKKIFIWCKTLKIKKNENNIKKQKIKIRYIIKYKNVAKKVPNVLKYLEKFPNFVFKIPQNHNHFSESSRKIMTMYAIAIAAPKRRYIMVKKKGPKLNYRNIFFQNRKNKRFFNKTQYKYAINNKAKFKSSKKQAITNIKTNKKQIINNKAKFKSNKKQAITNIKTNKKQVITNKTNIKNNKKQIINNKTKFKSNKKQAKTNIKTNKKQIINNKNKYKNTYQTSAQIIINKIKYKNAYQSEYQQSKNYTMNKHFLNQKIKYIMNTTNGKNKYYVDLYSFYKTAKLNRNWLYWLKTKKHRLTTIFLRKVHNYNIERFFFEKNIKEDVKMRPGFFFYSKHHKSEYIRKYYKTLYFVENTFQTFDVYQKKIFKKKFKKQIVKLPILLKKRRQKKYRLFYKKYNRIDKKFFKNVANFGNLLIFLFKKRNPFLKKVAKALKKKKHKIVFKKYMKKKWYFLKNIFIKKKKKKTKFFKQDIFFFFKMENLYKLSTTTKWKNII